MTDFQVGDRVRLSPDSIYAGRDDSTNPEGVDGTVTEIMERPSNPLPVLVTWSNEAFNSYAPHDLYKVEEWVMVTSNSTAGRRRWGRLLDKLDRLNGRVCHWPQISNRVFVNLATRQYTNRVSDVGPAYAEVPSVTLSEILQEEF